jgi:hypothetical protein
MGLNGRDYVELHFTRDVITQRYRQALEEVVEPQRAHKPVAGVWPGEPMVQVEQRPKPIEIEFD